MEELADRSHVNADGVSHRLDPRWIPYRRQVALVGSAPVAIMLVGAAAVLARIGDLPATPVMIVALSLAVVTGGVRLWWPGPAWRYASYRLSARALEIRRGVLFRSWIDVPRSRVQHSDVSQGPFERMYGLGTLSVYTAGTHYALVRLHGLDHSRALAIRDHLMQADADDVV